MKLAKALRSHRENARTARALSRALSGAEPAFRDELIVVAQRAGSMIPRV